MVINEGSGGGGKSTWVFPFNLMQTKNGRLSSNPLYFGGLDLDLPDHLAF